MRPAILRKPNSHMVPLEFERPNSCAEDFSLMWRHSLPNSVRLSVDVLGMVNHTLDAEVIVRASRDLAESVREVCVWDTRQRALSSGTWLFCDNWNVPHIKNYFCRDNQDGVTLAVIPLSGNITTPLMDSYCVNRSVVERDESLERLSSYYYFKDTVVVVNFLEQHPYLVDVLFETRRQFDHYFSPETRSSLEVFTDPEDNHSAPKLFALILTSLSSDDASTRLDRLDQEWWLNEPSEVRRVLNIDVDYIDGV